MLNSLSTDTRYATRLFIKLKAASFCRHSSSLLLFMHDEEDEESNSGNRSSETRLRLFTFAPLKSHQSVNGCPQDLLNIYIPEVLSEAFGFYVWPCSKVLADFVWCNSDIFAGKTVLELGAGTALPGLVAAGVGAARVVLTDVPDACTRCSASVQMNNLSPAIVDVAELIWGSFTPGVLALPKPDVLLGADCLYNPEDFDSLFASIHFFMEATPGCTFYTTYQERSSNRTLQLELLKWGLVAEVLPLPPSPSAARTKHGESSMDTSLIDEQEGNYIEEKSNEKGGVMRGSVFLIAIRKKSSLGCGRVVRGP